MHHAQLRMDVLTKLFGRTGWLATLAFSSACGASEPELAQSQAALTAGPTITLTAPAKFSPIQYQPAGTTVSVSWSVSGATLGAGDHEVKLYLDGIEQAQTTATLFDLIQVPKGQRHIAARLVKPDGSFYTHPESLATLYIRVLDVCASETDCSDGLTCSTEACVTGSCRYGTTPECCDQDLECPVGWHCAGNYCRECLDSSECTAGGPCQVGSCGVDGSCYYESIPGCCASDTDCGDGDLCTTDTCDLATKSCSHAPSGDPLCCDDAADCKPENPCQPYMCYQQVAGTAGRCRYGQLLDACCTTASDCQTSNLCEVGTCTFNQPEDAVGFCSFTPKDSFGTCCTTHADCDDANGATLDQCVQNLCQNPLDPDYCALPATSALVITELAASPANGFVTDADAEWIELHNPGQSTIALEGWSISVSGGGSHTLIGSLAAGGPGVKIYPGQYVVLARSADKSKNGGFTPLYAYGSDLTLPDPFSTGGAVSYTVTLKDPAGQVVDSVPVSSTSWGFAKAQSFELKHPHLDNALASSWTTTEHSLFFRYGYVDNELYGSPNAMSWMAEGIPDASCSLPAGAHACAIPACGLDGRCMLGMQEGCCETDLDCTDQNACTSDHCDVQTLTCLPSTADPNCCETHAECDDQNPCNLDRCFNRHCRHSDNFIEGCCASDADCKVGGDTCNVFACDLQANACSTTPVGGCCTTHDQCADLDPASLDTCASGVCTHPPNPEYCASAGDACNDGNACTADSCDLAAKTCQHSPIAGCCLADAGCADDGDVCTTHTCDLALHTCRTTAVAGCCNTSADCGDGDACTADTCSAGHACHHAAVAGCCHADGDCQDGLGCTTDACVANLCQATAIAGCCTPGADPATLAAQCGADPDGASPCQAWTCPASAQCTLAVNPTCCNTGADCQDGDGCTADACVSHLCKHTLVAEGCCDADSDCSEADGSSCTAPKCDAGICTEVATQACTPKLGAGLELDSDAPIGSGGWVAATGSCWATSTSGDLGPDAHPACSGTTGDPTRPLVFPGFDPDGAAAVTVSATLEVSGPASGTVTLWGAANPELTNAVPLGTVTLDGAGDLVVFHAELTPALLAAHSVYLGLTSATADAPNFSFGLDDAVAAPGSAPFFVSAVDPTGSYDEDQDHLQSGGTTTTPVTGSSTLTLSATDPDGSPLAFAVAGAPDFVTLAGVTTLAVERVTQATLAIQPDGCEDVGTWTFQVRVGEGLHYDVVEVTVRIAPSFTPPGDVTVYLDSFLGTEVMLAIPDLTWMCGATTLTWQEGQTVLGTGEDLTTLYGLGTHDIAITATGLAGTATQHVKVTVNESCGNGILESYPKKTKAAKCGLGTTVVANKAELDAWLVDQRTELKLNGSFDFAGGDLTISTQCKVSAAQPAELLNLRNVSIAAGEVDFHADLTVTGRIELRAASKVILRQGHTTTGANAVVYEAPVVDDHGEATFSGMWCAEGGDVILRQASRTSTGGGKVIIRGSTSVDLHGDLVDPSTVSVVSGGNLTLRQGATIQDTGDVSMLAEDDLDCYAVLQNVGRVELAAGGDLLWRQAARIAVGGDVSMEASREIDLHGQLSGVGNLTLDGDAVLIRTQARISGAGDVTVKAAAPTETIDWQGAVSGVHNVRVTAMGDLLLRQGGAISSSGDVTLSAGNFLEGRGSVTANQVVSMTTGTYKLYTGHDFGGNASCTLTGTKLSGSKAAVGCTEQ
jgi:hypothetical protein